jgi:hypothetical protein
VASKWRERRQDSLAGIWDQTLLIRALALSLVDDSQVAQFLHRFNLHLASPPEIHDIGSRLFVVFFSFFFFQPDFKTKERE